MKKGFFFTVDAIIAAIVLTAGVSMFFIAQPVKPDPTLVVTYAQGEMNLLTNTRLNELSILNPADYNFPDNTVMEQIIQYGVINSDSVKATELAGKLLMTKPHNIGICLKVHNASDIADFFDYNCGCTVDVNSCTNGIAKRARAGVSQTRIIYVRQPAAPYIDGPYIAKLEVWQ